MPLMHQAVSASSWAKACGARPRYPKKAAKLASTAAVSAAGAKSLRISGTRAPPVWTRRHERARTAQREDSALYCGLGKGREGLRAVQPPFFSPSIFD